MTIRTRIHGYTGWINMRLLPFEHILGNVLMDLLRGTNMKYLVQSFTGNKNDKFQSFESLTREQIQTRIKWVLQELKIQHVIPEDVQLDTRLFAVRSSKHVFDLLWRLVYHDIFFLWERIDFLSHTDDDVLIQVPFTWVPKPTNNHKKSIPEISHLTGFSFIGDMINSENQYQEEEKIDDSKRFPGLDIMKQFSIRKVEVNHAPDPKKCIIEMINIQLKFNLKLEEYQNIIERIRDEK